MSDQYDASKKMNGYGVKTSSLSITHLGAAPKPPPYQMSSNDYRAEANSVSDEVKRRHGPANRSLHLQKNFPETRRLMQPPYGRLAVMETPREFKDVSFPPHNMHKTKWDRDDQPFEKSDPQWSSKIVRERDWAVNNRRELMKRSEDATVNHIIAQQDKSGAPFKPGWSK